jgi:hypothetical protein
MTDTNTPRTTAPDRARRADGGADRGGSVTTDDIRVGDRVQRERGKQTVGIVEHIFTPTYGKRYPVAKVRWLDSFATFGGGTRDHHSTCAVVSLRKAE